MAVNGHQIMIPNCAAHISSVVKRWNILITRRTIRLCIPQLKARLWRGKKQRFPDLRGHLLIYNYLTFSDHYIYRKEQRDKRARILFVDNETQTLPTESAPVLRLFLCDQSPSEVGGRFDASTQATHIQVAPIAEPFSATLPTPPVAEIRASFCFESIKNDEECISVTGVNLQVFNVLLKFMEGYPAMDHAPDHLLICLYKLKLADPFVAIGTVFGMHRTSVQRIFSNVLDHLYIRTQNLIPWPSRQQIDDSMPPEFVSTYPKTRVIVDCTEVPVEKPGSLYLRNHLYSNYKSTETLKYLIGIAPSGLITFASVGFTGRSSDTLVLNDCGICHLLEQGDAVMADKGFPVVKTTGITTIIPPRAKPHQKQFTKAQMDETQKIASLRIHVERAIQRVKQFSILTDRLDDNMVPYCDKIFRVVCGIVNLCAPIIKQ